MKASRALLAAVLVAALAAPVGAQSTPDADLAHAAAVVLQQLDAFRRGDFGTAYGFASTMIRGMFDPAAFERMVTTGYPEIAKSTSAYVADGRHGPDESVQLVVKIRGANGNVIEALYELVREGGVFRINGVLVRPDDGASASASDSRRRTSSAGSATPPNRTRS